MSKGTLTVPLVKLTKEEIQAAAAERNLHARQFAYNCIEEVVTGKIIDHKIISQTAIELMEAVQEIRDNYPDTDVDRVERIGYKLCQISYLK
jgi:hypothetical protein